MGLRRLGQWRLVLPVAVCLLLAAVGIFALLPSEKEKAAKPPQPAEEKWGDIPAGDGLQKLTSAAKVNESLTAIEGVVSATWESVPKNQAAKPEYYRESRLKYTISGSAVRCVPESADSASSQGLSFSFNPEGLLRGLANFRVLWAKQQAGGNEPVWVGLEPNIEPRPGAKRLRIEVKIAGEPPCIVWASMIVGETAWFEARFTYQNVGAFVMLKTVSVSFPDGGIQHLEYHDYKVPRDGSGRGTSGGGGGPIRDTNAF